MRRLTLFGWLLALPVLSIVSSVHAGSLMALPFPKVHIKDDFWSKRIRINQMATLSANLLKWRVR